MGLVETKKLYVASARIGRSVEVLDLQSESVRYIAALLKNWALLCHGTWRSTTQLLSDDAQAEGVEPGRGSNLNLKVQRIGFLCAMDGVVVVLVLEGVFSRQLGCLR